jgi:DNA-binding Xre family transcriptional regulator
MPTYWTLKALLKARGLTPGAVAAKAGLHRQSLYAILKEPLAERIEGKTLDGLCDALGCEIGDLLTRTPPSAKSAKRKPR